MVSLFMVWLTVFSNTIVGFGNLGNDINNQRDGDYGITVNISQTNISSTVTFGWTAPDGHPANDYVRLAQVGYADNNYNWSQPLGSSTSGSFNVTIPNTVARYEFRLYRGDNNTRIAQSNSFVANKPDFSLSVSPLLFAAGGQITASWISPENRPVIDRIIISQINSSSILSEGYIGDSNSQTMNLVAPAQSGQYELKYYETGSGQPSAISQVFTVEDSAGSFTGQVKKGENAEYIQDAVIEALQNNVVKAATTTNSNGSYHLPVLVAGVYDLKVSASGYPVKLKTGINLTNGENVISNFDLFSTGFLNGKITRNGSSIPIPNANIQIKQGSELIRSGNTDQLGNYVIGEIVAGNYTVNVSAVGFISNNQENININVENPTVHNISLTAAQSGITNNLEYIYDDGGRLVAVKEQNVVKSIYSYDSSGNLLSIASPQGISPVIINFSPRIGLPGSQVLIQGINFSEIANQNTVSFNGISASIASSTSNEIIVTVPVGVATGPISVTTPNGTSTSNSIFTVGNPEGTVSPVISHFFPLIAHPGDVLTIVGNNFETEPSDNSVLIGNQETEVTSSTQTSLLARANTSSGKISVTTPNGRSISTGDFVSVPESIDVTKVNYAGQTWFGNFKTISIPTSDRKAALTINGVAGKRFSIQLFTLYGAAKIEVYRPDGKLMSSSSFNSQQPKKSWFVDTQTFPLSGTYTIIISPIGTTGTLFSLMVYDVPPDVSGEIQTYGEKSIWIGTPGQNGQLTFYSTVGQKILIRIKDSTHSGTASILLKNVTTTTGGGSPPSGPVGFGVVYVEGQESYSKDGTTTPASGIYTIFLDPSGPNTGAMKASLRFVPPDPIYSMNIGESKTIATTHQGENAFVEFNGTAGQRISLRSREVTYAGGFAMSITKPDGTFLHPIVQTNSDSFIDTLTLPTTGTYKILIDPQGYNTGQTTLDLYNVPPDVVGATSINGPSVTVNTVVPGQNPSVTFEAVQGQQARVNISSATVLNGTLLKLRKPDGLILSSSAINSGSGLLGSITLPESGIYRVEIDPAGATLGGATISVGGDVFGNVAPGNGTSSVTIDNPGQNAWLSFNGTAGQMVSLKLSDVTFTAGTVSFRNSNGFLIGNTLEIGTHNNFLDTITLPSTGEYKILIDPASSYTGSATINLYNVPANAAGSIAIGGNTETRTILTPGQNLSLVMSGTVNQKFGLEISGLDIPGTPRISIKKPDGSTLISENIGANGIIFNNTVLPVSGSYEVFVDPVNDSVGSITLQVYGTGTGNPNPTSQLIHSVSVNKGMLPNTSGTFFDSVSVKKGFDYGGFSDSQLLDSVSVRFGNLQNFLLSTEVSVTTGAVINSISPSQAVKGTTFTITVTGINLNNVSSLRFYDVSGNLDNGISVTGMNINQEGTALTATVQINSGVALGNRIVVLASPSGTTVRENIQTNVVNIIP